MASNCKVIKFVSKKNENVYHNTMSSSSQSLGQSTYNNSKATCGQQQLLLRVYNKTNLQLVIHGGFDCLYNLKSWGRKEGNLTPQYESNLPVLQNGEHSEATTMTFITFGPAKGLESLPSLSSTELAASVTLAASDLTSTGSATPAVSLSSNVGFDSATCELAPVLVLAPGAGCSVLGSDTGAPFCFAALLLCCGVDATGLGDEAEPMVSAA
jgi:hypothetical protein